MIKIKGNWLGRIGGTTREGQAGCVIAERGIVLIRVKKMGHIRAWRLQGGFRL